MKGEDLIKRLDELISLGAEALSTMRGGSPGIIPYVDGGKFSGFRASCLSFLGRTFGREHVYFREFEQNVSSSFVTNVKQGIGILEAARNEVAAGWLFSVKGLISAEIFADFIQMGEYLLSEDYKDATAVMIGSVLEERLRQLCEKNKIPTYRVKGGKNVPKTADALNAELAKAGVYDKLEMKNVLGWLELRNRAAHGKYQEYDKKQVELMLQGVRDFITRVR